MFRTGTKVKLSETAKENDYYKSFHSHTLVITGWADHYSNNRNDIHGHPGYDAGTGEILYDLFDTTTGEECPNSLYDYELVRAGRRLKIVAFHSTRLDKETSFVSYYHLKCWRENLSKSISRKRLQDATEWPVGTTCMNCGEPLYVLDK